MIAVRIPEEIRKYKEKILFGLNARQLLSTIAAVAICAAIYFGGKDYINSELMGWLLIGVALALGSIGFFNYRGLPAEKFAFALIKYFFLYPMKRKYRVDNAYKNWQNQATREELMKQPKLTVLDTIKNTEKSLERAVYMEDEENGDVSQSDTQGSVLTVSTSGNGNPKKPKKDKTEKRTHREDKKSQLQKRAEEIEAKIKADSHYLPTKAEQNIRKRWNCLLEKQRRQELNNKKNAMRKKNSAMEKRRKAKTAIPKSTQDTIPFIADYDEGLIEVKANKYSKMYRIQDINYRTGKQEEQETIFCKYAEFLNHFSEDLNVAISIDNRVVSLEEQENRILYPLTGNAYDRHREEMNRILRKQIMTGRNDIQVEKYLTVTIDAATPIEALFRFHKIDAEVISNIRKIGSNATVLTTEERLSYYHDKYRRGHEGELNIDFDWIKLQGISSKDYIAPSMIEFNKKHFRIEDSYYRVVHLCNLPASLSDEFFYDLCDNDFPITTTLNIQPVSQEKGMRIVRRQLTGIQKDKEAAERRAIKGNYNPDSIKHSIKDAYAQAEMLYDDMLNKNQKMFFVTITCMIQGDSLEALEDNCKTVANKARKIAAQMMPLTYQQEEGYKITLPFGYAPQDISVERALTTESTAIFIPFANQELFQPGGYYYGINQISRNLVVVDRLKMKTPSGFVLGTSGSGKSFATKREIVNILLHDDLTNILIIDPENEYGDFCRAFGGSVLKISSDSNIHINPMDMDADYGLDEDDPYDTPLEIKKNKAIKKKSEFILSIVEGMLNAGGNDTIQNPITPRQKTIIDRCVSRCYSEFLAHNFDPEYQPTLVDLQKELDKERGSEDGASIAESVEYYTKGNMDVFSHKTNINVKNRLVVFNVRDLGEQLRHVALNIVFDFIWNRMVENKERKVRTYCYCDEIHTMFKSLYSADVLKQLYKRGRKYGLCITGMTQNVSDLLKSEQAKGMLGNSDFIMMLNQKSEDLRLLAEMPELNMSEAQMGFLIGAEAGSGLLFAENIVVPFIDRFPVDSYLYSLMSTKFGEDMSGDEIQKEVNKIISRAEDTVPV